MAQYRVLKQFTDIETKEVYEPGQEIEMTVKRAEEAAKNLKRWNCDFLKRIDNIDEEEIDEPEDETEETEEG